MSTPLVVTDAAAEQAAATRRVLRLKLIVWTVVTVILVGLTATLWLWVESVTAWQDDIRTDGVRSTATVLDVLDDHGRRSDDRALLRVDAPSPFTVTMHQVIVSRYTEGDEITVWYEPSHPDRIATEWETNTTNRQSTVTLVMLLVGIFALMSLGRWAWCMRAVRYSWGGEVTVVVITHAAVRRTRKRQRTLLSFEDARGPWCCRQAVTVQVGGGISVIATDKHRVVCAEQPFVVRRAWWEWTRRRWLRELKTA